MKFESMKEIIEVALLNLTYQEGLNIQQDGTILQEQSDLGQLVKDETACGDGSHIVEKSKDGDADGGSNMSGQGD